MLRRYKPVVQLSGHGETLLHPDFMEMLEETIGAGCKVTFQTNGTLLSPRIVERIVDLGVEGIVISLDGATPEVFDQIRRRARLDKILANIRQLNEEKKRRSTDRPRLGIEFVAMRRNIHELPGVVRLAGQLGAVHVQVAELIEFNLTRGESLSGSPAILPWVVKAEEEARRWSIPLILPPRIPGRNLAETREALVQLGTAGEGYPELRKTCREPWEKISVQFNGVVQPCCMITDSHGNLLHESFEAIWSGPKYQRLRDSLMSDHPLPVCEKCLFYGWERKELADSERQLMRLLHRLNSPKPDEELTQLRTGRRTLNDTCVALLENGEAIGSAVFVERAYRALLGRAPDEGGFQGYVTALQAGHLCRTALIGDFVCSPEFSGAFGSLAVYLQP